jgi:hypothetical protein
MHVQTSATRMQYFHGSLLAAVGVEPPLMNSNKRAPGRMPVRGAVGGAQGLRVQLENGLKRTKDTTDLCADDLLSIPPVSSAAGRPLSVRTRKKLTGG